MNFAHPRVNNVVRQVLFIIGLIILAAVIFKELEFFLGGALGAFTFYVILKRPFVFLVEKKRWNKSLSALLLIVLLVFVLLLFGAATFEMVISRISDFDSQSIQEGLKTVSNVVKDMTGYQIHSSKMIEQVKEAFLNQASGVLNSAYGFIANLLMMIFMLFFMLVHYMRMETTFIRIVPFKGKTLRKLTRETKGMIVSNAVGIPAIMIAQGSVAMLGYWIFGIEDPVFWGVITGFFSIIPIVGTTVVWGTLSIYLLTTGHVWQGVGLLAYSAVVIGSMDNVVRILLGKFMADTHPVVTILGVIMGLRLFGFWGIIFGPLLIDMFILLLKIYRSEYLHDKVDDLDMDIKVEHAADPKP